MKWMIAVFVLTLIALKLSIGVTPAPLPVINLDANAHQITFVGSCTGDNLQKTDVYVDGIYYLSTTNASPKPSGFSVVRK